MFDYFYLNDDFILTLLWLICSQYAVIAEHPSSAEVLKPLLRGRDVKRWQVESVDLYLLFIPWHFPLHQDSNITGVSDKAEQELKKLYPAIYAHLLKFKTGLSARNKAEIGIRYEWYALQRYGSSYWQEFEQPKIIYPDIAQRSEFTYDSEGVYLINTFYLLPTKELWLLAVLNSSLIYWFYTQISPAIRGGFVRFIAQYVSQIPIPTTTDFQREAIEILVEQCLDAEGKDIKHIEKEIDRLVYQLYGLTEAEIKIIESAP